MTNASRHPRPHRTFGPQHDVRLLVLLAALVLAVPAGAQRITNGIVSPHSGVDTLTLLGRDFGTQPGTIYVFVAGRPTALELLGDWSDTALVAQLPALSPGTYRVLVQPPDRVPAMLDLTLGASVPVANFSPAPETGQSGCWNNFGKRVFCDGTGQDGDLRSGVKPPSPRFVDRHDGTILDRLTGIVWLRDWECLGRQEWEPGLMLVRQLGDGQCGLSGGYEPGDFSLPNVKQMASLVDYTSIVGLPEDYPFVFSPGDAWTSTSLDADPTQAWSFGATTPDLRFLKPKIKPQGNFLPAVYVR